MENRHGDHEIVAFATHLHSNFIKLKVIYHSLRKFVEKPKRNPIYSVLPNSN